jgi:hypothetical protein
MSVGPITAEDLASAVRAMTEAQRESALRQDTFAARFEQHGARMETFAARLDQHAERLEQMNERQSARLDRMEEQLSTVYDILTRKNAGFAR